MRRVLVSGCSKGIGLAIAKALLQEGWIVRGMARSSAAPIEHEQFRYITGSVAGTMDGRATENRLRSFIGGPLDALVHCAATRGPVGPLASNHTGAWGDTIWTNLIGTFNVVQALLPMLRESPDARILLFSGGGAFGPRANYSAYAASKAGVVSLMETLAVELQGTSVTVNCVAPGFIPTGIHAATWAAGPETAGEAAYREVVHGTAEDDGSALVNVLDCVMHLLGPETAGLTGKTVSAVHDAWKTITPETVELVNAAPVGKVSRQKIPPYEPAGNFVYTQGYGGTRVRMRVAGP